MAEPFRVLVAPDSFKGTFSAGEVADAIAEGVEATGGIADRCPLADGGEGTMEVLSTALGGRFIPVSVTDALGRPTEAGFTELKDGETAIVEMALASGMAKIPPEERDAEAASTFGTGQLIAAAIDGGARQILVGVGGSATTDGGRGCLDAIERAGGVRQAELIVLCDVRVPWEAAPVIFAPQKGADAEAVERLSARLDRFAEELPRDPRGVPRTGAAGGLSGGLWAACDARLVSGADWILDAVEFDRRAAASDLVVTGEGRLDSQTQEGKLIGTLLDRTAGMDLQRIAAVGRNDLSPEAASELGLDRVTETPDRERMVEFGRSLIAG